MIRRFLALAAAVALALAVPSAAVAAQTHPDPSCWWQPQPGCFF